MENIIIVLVIVGLVYAEYNYRSKRDGKKESVNAILFAAVIFLSGLFAQHYFDQFGLVAVLLFMGALAIAFVIQDKVRSKK
jgi:hypothetical protein